MGFETDNAEFRNAAEDLRAVHDGSVAATADAFLKTAGAPTLGKTDGSPIGAAAAELEDVTAQIADDSEVQYEPGPKFPEFLKVVLDAAMAQAAAAAAEAEEAEIEEDVEDLFSVAQTLSAMSTSADTLADTLEAAGMGDVAEFVREAASKVRKGAKLARANARTALTVLDGTDV